MGCGKGYGKKKNKHVGKKMGRLFIERGTDVCGLCENGVKKKKNDKKE